MYASWIISPILILFAFVSWSAVRKGEDYEYGIYYF